MLMCVARERILLLIACFMTKSTVRGVRRAFFSAPSRYFLLLRLLLFDHSARLLFLPPQLSLRSVKRLFLCHAMFQATSNRL